MCTYSKDVMIYVGVILSIIFVWFAVVIDFKSTICLPQQPLRPVGGFILPSMADTLIFYIDFAGNYQYGDNSECVCRVPMSQMDYNEWMSRISN